MVEKRMRGGDVPPGVAATTPESHTFNQWLQSQLKARKLTQRQLARKSGVDHSTISRLMRGNRVPSLQTATLLAYSLGVPQEPGTLDHDRVDGGGPAARVEYALRSDDLLTEEQVREIMNVYLEARFRRPRNVATPATVRTTSRTSVPIVAEIPRLRPRSISIGGPATVVRRRSS